MPANKSAEKALAALNSDASKTLGLTVGQTCGSPARDVYTQSRCTITTGGPVPSSISRQDLPDHEPGHGRALQVAPHPRPHLALVPIRSEGFQRRHHQYCASGATRVGRVARGELHWPRAAAGAAPHRYAFFLYEQPAGFDAKAQSPAKGKEVGVKPRMWFSLDDWEAKVGLGEVLALNYFTSN
ncbi:PEBP-like protein [Apiospora arundinis]